MIWETVAVLSSDSLNLSLKLWFVVTTQVGRNSIATLGLRNGDGSR